MTRSMLYVSAAAISIFAVGCTESTSANNNPAPVKVEGAPDPNLYQPKQAEQFPLAAVEIRHVPDELLLNGAVAPDVQRTVHVTSLSAGRVVEVRARLGDQVHQGQVLLVLNSPDLALAISDYKKSQADEVLSRKALDRAQLLYSRGALAQKELETAEDAETKARVDVTTAAERIRLLGGDLDRMSPVIEVKAPVSGTIVEQNTAGGEGIKSLDNSPSLFTIADLSRVWVLCDVYENDFPQVHVGDFADVRLNAYPDQPFRGRVNNVSSVLDPATRTAKVRLELANRAGMLKPGMFATARFVSERRHDRVVVPASAILRLHDKYWVFRSEGQGRFRRTEVQAGPAMADGRQEVLAGAVRPGDQIVTNALEFSSSVEQM